MVPGVDYAPSEDISGRAIYPPKYPAAALIACAFGRVQLLVTIDATGHVASVEVAESSGNADLDQAAADAARYWRFTPGKSGGKAVGGQVIVPVNFQNPC